jgi:hypothetical protein
VAPAPLPAPLRDPILLEGDPSVPALARLPRTIRRRRRSGHAGRGIDRGPGTKIGTAAGATGIAAAEGIGTEIETAGRAERGARADTSRGRRGKKQVLHMVVFARCDKVASSLRMPSIHHNQSFSSYHSLYLSRPWQIFNLNFWTTYFQILNFLTTF